VVQTLGYNLNVGWTGLTPETDPIGATPKGEEVLVPLFEKANAGNVVITPVARYSPSQVLPFGFYTKSGSTPCVRPWAPSRAWPGSTRRSSRPSPRAPTSLTRAVPRSASTCWACKTA
jgi:hypothetical protein